MRTPLYFAILAISLLWVHSSDWSQLQPVKSHKLYQDLLAPYLDIALRLAGLDGKGDKELERSDSVADFSGQQEADDSVMPKPSDSQSGMGGAESGAPSSEELESMPAIENSAPVESVEEGSEGWGPGVALRAEEAEDVVDFKNFPRRASRGPASLTASMNEPISRAAYQRVLNLLSGGNCEGASQEIERSMKRFSLERDSEWVVKVRGELDSRCF